MTKEKLIERREQLQRELTHISLQYQAVLAELGRLIVEEEKEKEDGVPNPPSDFVAHLKRDCPHLRIRWSKANGEWHVEQRVGRAALVPLRVDEVDDRFIRARDGYRFVLAVRPGDRMPCGLCGLDIKVPHLKLSMLTCEYCLRKATDPRTNPKDRKVFRAAVGYFPLGEALLEHLRRTNPFRGGTEVQLEEVKLAEIRKEMRELRERQNHNEAVSKDGFNRMFGIQSVGYTGNSTRFIHRSKW